MGGGSIDFGWSITLTTSLTFLAKLIPVFPKQALTRFDQTIRGILKAREKSGMVKQDMVNSVLEIFQKSNSDPKYKELGITETTAIAQAMEFFIASFEGVRTNLTVLTYYLAMFPEIQDRIFEEIDPIIEKYNGQITAETVADLPYLTACLSEVFRISPGFFRLDRKCTKDWKHSGIKIKKGMHVVFPLWALHRDPDQYPEPEKFDPERFLPF